MPPVERDARLRACVAAYLRTLGYVNEPFKVLVRWCGLRLELSEGADWPEATEAPPPPGRWLSPLEQRIVDFLAGRPEVWTRGEDVAAGLGEPYQHRFKAIIANLCEREVIDVQQGLGYRPLARAANPERARVPVTRAE